MTAEAGAPPPPIQGGTRLGRYRIERLLGEGGMGAVYEATHVDLQKRVAIKTLHPNLASKPELRARFLREGVAASRLRHPNVVDVFDVGSQDGVAFLVMEFLEGETLAARLARERVLDVPDLVEVILPVLSAVMTAHDEGIIHRDLKPENIFLVHARDGGTIPMVLDFGISKVVSTQDPTALTGTEAMMGTPHYMSPEQVRSSKHVDARTDQYALGVILYECIAGRRPFEGESVYAIFRAIDEGRCASLGSLRAALPVGFDAVVHRAMHVEAASRHPSVGALASGLLPFARQNVRDLWATKLGSPAAGLERQATVANVASPDTFANTSRAVTLARAQARGRSSRSARMGAVLAVVLVGGTVLGLSLSRRAASNRPTAVTSPARPLASTLVQSMAQPAVPPPPSTPMVAGLPTGQRPSDAGSASLSRPAASTGTVQTRRTMLATSSMHRQPPGTGDPPGRPDLPAATSSPASPEPRPSQVRVVVE